MGERKVYVTKYALMEGILHCQVHESWTAGATGTGWIYVSHLDTSNKSVGFQSGDWHDTLDAAQARVREMAKAKLRSLDKQRANLVKICVDGAKVVEK